MESLTVADPTTSSTAIVDAFFPTTSGLSVDTGTISIVSGSSSIGFYSDPNASLGLTSGLLITSGTMPGFTNTVGWYGQDNGMAGDPALDAVVNTVFSTVSYDATTISFDFTVTDPSITGISFKVVFGTDEFPEWVDQFVDIAVVLVNGTNVAYFNNDPGAPLSVVTPNLAAGYFIDNADGHLPIEYDGVSGVLNVYAPVHYGVNSLTIGIADTGDHIYDSGLFISNLQATNVPIGGVSLDVPCTEGADDKVGSAASETFNALGGDDSIDGAGGDDVLLGGGGADSLQGGDGKDFLDGGVDHDLVNGGAGDDTIQFAGDDVIDGGDGVDTLLIDGSILGGPVALDLSDPAAAQALGDGSTVQNMEVLNFTGGAEVDDVKGGAYADKIHTGAGDDHIDGGEGGDDIDGGDGNDTAVFAGASTDYLVTDLGAGVFQVANLVTGGSDKLANVEQVQFADGSFALAGLVITGATIYGTSEDDKISPTGPYAPYATALGDIIYGEGGNDVIKSGAGDDIIYGGAGDDEVDGGTGVDTMVYDGAYADYWVRVGGDGWLVDDLRVGGADGQDQLKSIEHIQFADTMMTVGEGAPPVVTGGSMSGDVIEPLAPTGLQTLTGAFTFTDPDHDNSTHWIEVFSPSGNDTGVTFTPNMDVDATEKTPGVVSWSLDVDTDIIDAMAEGQVRTLTYTVRINDNGGNHVDQDVVFTLTGTNDEPVVSGPVGLTANAGDGVVSINALAAASDVDAGAKLIVTGLPAILPAGVTFDTQTHSFVLDPSNPAFAALPLGEASIFGFDYEVTDGYATVAAHAEFTVMGTASGPTNTAPVAQAGSGATAEDTALTGTVTATDADNDALTYSLVGQAQHGVVDLAGDGSYTYTPNADWNGADSFTFKANDGQADSTAAAVSLTVTAVNDAPTAQAASASGSEDNQIKGQLSATDIDSATLHYALATGPAHGQVLITDSGAYTYTPGANWSGGDSFTFTAGDGVATSAAATVSLTVAAVNDAPVAAAPLSAQNGQEGSAFTYAVPAGAFTDADGDALAFTATLADGSALPSWLSFDATTRTFSGTPTAAGSYSVKVTATDPSNAAASSTFALSVAGGVTLTGTAGADNLTGTAFADHIYGLGGGDTLRGMGGDDWLEGGAGNDLIDGGTGIDTASYANATGAVTVSLASTKAQATGGAGKDTLSGIENLTGSAFGDTLTGSAGANRIDGGAGADVINGGAGGGDILIGGAGADRFVFSALGDSPLANGDTVLDLTRADGDRIDLSAIDAIAGGKKNEAFVLISGDFTKHAGELSAAFATDHWVVQGDVNGDGVADFSINVVGTLANPLMASDFLL